MNRELGRERIADELADLKGELEMMGINEIDTDTISEVVSAVIRLTRLVGRINGRLP